MNVYDDTYSIKPPVEQIFHSVCDNWYLNRLERHGASHIVDVGAGDGRMTKKLLSRGFEVTVVEKNTQFAMDIRDRNATQHSLHVIDKPFSDVVVDADAILFSFGVLNHSGIGDLLRAKRMADVVLGWVSQTNSANVLLRMDHEDYQSVRRSEKMSYTKWAEEQYNENSTSTLQNYGRSTIKLNTDLMIPFPTFLFTVDWQCDDYRKLFELAVRDVETLDARNCSGYLFEAEGI